MNYTEEQSNELEALAAIYPNEYSIIYRKPAKFTVLVRSEQMIDENEEVSDPIYEVLLLFTLPDTYPDELPEIEIQESINLEDYDERELLDLLELTAKDSRGMVMIFTLVTTAIDWINQKSDEKKIEMKETVERKKREEEALEMKKFEGTIVTVESFLVWKNKFGSEMNQSIKSKKVDSSKKLTGKEMFFINKNLNESDLQFLDDGITDGDFDEVKVDEALFQDMDDLDIEDNDR